MNTKRIMTLTGSLALLSTPALLGFAAQPDKAPPASGDQASTPPHATAETVKKLEAKTGLPVGWYAPEVSLKNADGETVGLKDLYLTGPTVVAFYRGGWCPFCNKQLKDWQDYEADFKDAGLNVVFITPESVEHVAETVEKNGSTFRVLSDSEQKASTLFNVIFKLDDDTKAKYKGYGIDLESWNANADWKLPVPGVFLIDKEGVVRWQDVNEDYRVRVSPETVLAEAAKL